MTEGFSRPQPPQRRRRRDPTPLHVSIPSLGATCRWIREDRDLTREQAARVLRLSTSHLRRIERGVSMPHQNTLQAIIRGYHLPQAMATHLHDLVIPAIPLTPVEHLRTHVLADTALTLNLERFQAREVLASYVDPMGNMLARNDLFANTLTGIDGIGSFPVWMFSEHSKDVLIDPESECSWSVSMLKAALGRHRASTQARDLVHAMASISQAQQQWAASLSVSHGRDSSFLMHAYDASRNPVSYQIAMTDGILAQHIQLFTATPEPYSGPELHQP
ncbi:helix-turn-helix domain-containing protein [Nocardia sp. NPDC058497]|uniref:helix-turn-helix domain-containing protein n=1 Tax=Nocardia sp. NPDC058497 TaxID=3346529 RepID=UPI0036639F32